MNENSSYTEQNQAEDRLAQALPQLTEDQVAEDATEEQVVEGDSADEEVVEDAAEDQVVEGDSADEDAVDEVVADDEGTTDEPESDPEV